MKKIKPLFFILIALGSIYTKAQPIFITDSLDIFIQREMNRWNIPGLAIAIVKDGNIVLQKGYGVREFGKNEKVDENTLFQIASNTKAFTSTALALLNHRNQLNLDQPLVSYIPWFKLYDTLSTALVTPRDLLCHRIGMKTFQGDFLNWGSNLTRREIIEQMALTKPVHPFRYQYGYCNAAYVTAGELIKYVTDTTWDDYLATHFFKPLGLNRTNTFYNQMLHDNNACKPHTKTIDGILKVLPLINIDNMGASACINSCVADMAKWVQLQLSNGIYNNKQILPAQVIAETRKSHMVNTDVRSSVFKSKHFCKLWFGLADV